MGSICQGREVDRPVEGEDLLKGGGPLHEREEFGRLDGDRRQGRERGCQEEMV